MTTPDEVQQLTTDPDVDELEDLEISPGFDRSQIEWSVLRSPIVVRALAGATVATLVLIWPTRTDRILANLIGIGLLVLSSISIWSLLRSRSRVVIDGLVALGGLGAGVFVLASPAASEVALSRLVGAAIVVAAGRDLVRLHVRALVRSQPWSSIRVVSMLGAGGLLLAFPAELFAASTILFALAWMASAVLVLVISITSHSEEPSGFVDSAHLVGAWLIDRPKSVEDRQALYDRILYEGPMTTQRLVRFFTLMSFASIIASMGVIADSTAVVIGAMLIAPLMTPLMGMAISLVMGWPRRLTRSTLVAGAGIILSIGLGVVWGLATPTVIDTTTNSQIVARSSPTVLDLIIALAAGAAGAYALSRPDVSDSLPGVAISIALVPPLSVVGISYAQGDWSSGHGALLLFATNMLAILVMGGLTFVATGVTPVVRVAKNQYRVRTALSAVGVLAALVIGSLLINGSQIASDLVNQSTIDAAVATWIDDHPDHSLVRIDVDGDTITPIISGPSAGSPNAASLATELSRVLDRRVTVQVRLLVEERQTATSGE